MLRWNPLPAYSCRPRFTSRLRAFLLTVVLTLAVTGGLFGPSSTFAANEAAEASPAATPERSGGVLQILKDGGTIGFIIILLSVVSLTLIIEHAITIRRERLMPSAEGRDLEILIKARKIDDALRYCQEAPKESLLTSVVQAGLLRYRTAEYGFAEYRAAVEEAGEEQTAKLYRKTEFLSVIGAIAPMLGLLGTVQGMIEAFNTIAGSGGMAKPADLAGSISKALVTTLEGLIVAIPTLAALSFFRTRIDSLVAETGKRVEQILAPLGRQQR